MSKVYGFCDAGCKYPVVKEDEFLKAAAFIETDSNILAVGNRYKIYDSGTNSWKLKIVCKFNIDYRGNIREQTINLTLPTFDKYDRVLTVKICEVKVSDQATSMSIVYDVNGERKTYVYNTNDLDATIILVDNVVVENASKVYVVNENGGYNIGGTSGLPIEISTEEEMTAVLVESNVGKIYKYTGVTGTYTNGALYQVVIE